MHTLPRRSELRHPLELPAVAVCIVVNVLIVAAAIALVWRGSAWLEGHPFFGRHVDAIRALAVAAVLAVPAEVVDRHVRHYADMGNGIRVSRTQLARCHEILERACRRLGVEKIPELYLVPHSDLDTVSAAYSVVGQRSLIALSTDIFPKDWEQNERAIAFAIGHAVGALRLGHTQWWLEILTNYAMRLPFLRTPIRAVQCFSRDRCGALVEPNGISGLILHAAGKQLVSRIDVPSFVDQAMHFGGFWSVVAGTNRKRPHLMLRARLLYQAKLFDYERDTKRS
jgi:hypothetical protein